MIVAACILDTLWIQSLDDLTLKSPSSAPLLSKYILRLGQSAQKQQRPLCPNRKMYLEIRGADEGFFRVIEVSTYQHFYTLDSLAYFQVNRKPKKRPNSAFQRSLVGLCQPFF